MKKALYKKICALKKIIWPQPVFGGQKTSKICDSKQFAIMQNYLYKEYNLQENILYNEDYNM